MTQILNQQWYDQNTERSYPLFDGVTGIDTTGLFAIPTGLLVDATITATSGYDSNQFYIAALAAFGTGIVITIGCAGTNVAVCTIPLTSLAEYTAYQITPLPTNTVGGTLTVGPVSAVLAASSGSYTFVQANSLFLPTVVFPVQPSVSSITFVDAFNNQTILTGPITLVAGTNATISTTGQTITIGMQPGIVLQSPCECLDESGNNRQAVRTINGVAPDGTGNIEIVPFGCPTISTGAASITLSDNCAQPCCGDAEVTTLAQSASDLNRDIAALAQRSAELQGVLATLQNYVNG